MHELLPSANKVLYLDADTVVRGDVAELLDASLANDELCAATPRRTLLGDKGVASLRGSKLQACVDVIVHSMPVLICGCLWLCCIAPVLK